MVPLLSAGDDTCGGGLGGVAMEGIDQLCEVDVVLAIALLILGILAGLVWAKK